MHRLANLLATLAVLAAASAAKAEIIATNSSSSTLNGVAPSSSDLVQAGTATLESANAIGFTENGALDFANINDGFSEANSDGVFEYEGDGGGTWTAEFVLDTTTNTLGYDITQIDSIASWHSSRVDQRVTVSYNTVSDASYVTLGTYLNTEIGANTGASLIRLTDTTGVIASGVKTLRVEYTLGDSVLASGHMPVVQEVDVFGTATTVPEPSSMILAIFSALAFGVYSRSKRSELSQISG